MWLNQRSRRRDQLTLVAWHGLCRAHVGAVYPVWRAIPGYLGFYSKGERQGAQQKSNCSSLISNERRPGYAHKPQFTMRQRRLVLLFPTAHGATTAAELPLQPIFLLG